MEGSESLTHGLPLCGLCGELIGVYEPMLIEGLEGARVTSLAAEPELAVGELLCRHTACAETTSDGAAAASS